MKGRRRVLVTRKDGIKQHYWYKNFPIFFRYDKIIRFTGYEAHKTHSFQIHGYIFTWGAPNSRDKAKVCDAITKVRAKVTYFYKDVEEVETNEGVKQVDKYAVRGSGFYYAIVNFTDENRGFTEKNLFKKHISRF